MALLHYIAELKCLTKESLEDVEIIIYAICAIYVASIPNEYHCKSMHENGTNIM